MSVQQHISEKWDRIDQLLKFYSTELHIYGVDKKMQHSNNLVLFIMIITCESQSRMVICI